MERAAAWPTPPYNGVMSAVDLDPTDHQILDLLSQNARRTMADIGERVSLSASAVTRRIERLERAGVIAGYTTVIDHGKVGRPIQAFTEVRFAGTADLKEIKETAIQLPEVQAVFTTAGDPDALVWLQVPDVERLGQVIEQLRRRGRVTGTKTLIVLDTWSRQRAFEPDRVHGTAAVRPIAGPARLAPADDRSQRRGEPPPSRPAGRPGPECDRSGCAGARQARCVPSRPGAIRAGRPAPAAPTGSCRP